MVTPKKTDPKKPETTSFDLWLEFRRKFGGPPQEVLDAFIEVDGNLEGAMNVCETCFGAGNDKPDHVLRVLELVYSRIQKVE